MNILKFIFFWPIHIIQMIVLFPIYLITTIFFQKGMLAELARRRDLIGIHNLITQGYDVNEKNAFGQTPLHGVFFDSVELSVNPYLAIRTIKYLIDAGADVNAVDRRNWSPLLYAIGADYIDESIYLINTEHILLNKRFYEGRTALHYTAIKSNSTIAKYLLEKGADPHIKDSFGLKPIDYCKSISVRNIFLDKCFSY